MGGRSTRRHGYAPLSAEAQTWEREQSRAMGLEDVPWDSEDGCPWCGCHRPRLHDEGPGLREREELLLYVAAMVVIAVLAVGVGSALRGH